MPFHGINKAVNEFNVNTDTGLYSRVYLNINTGEIWTDTHTARAGKIFYPMNIIEIYKTPAAPIVLNTLALRTRAAVIARGYSPLVK